MLNRLKKIILFGGDFVFLHLALVLTLLCRYGQPDLKTNFYNHWLHFLVVFVIWLLILYINNLYNVNLRVTSRYFLYPTINAIILSSLFSILYFYLNVNSTIAPKTNLAIFIVIFIVLFLLWRYLYQKITHSLLPKGNLAIIGNNARTKELIRELKNNPSFEYQVAMIFNNSMELEQLSNHIRERKIKAIVVTDDFGNDKRIHQILFDCLKYKITFFNYPDLYELLTGKIAIEAIDPNWFLSNLKEGQKNYFNLSKRLVDFVLALIILIISLPFWPLIALGVKLSSPGHVFFTQMRLGINGQAFKILKFRTMREENNDRSPTQPNDGRVTSFGLFLRKARIDEVPQIINVLRNEMSFIGPRPERLEIAINLEKDIPFYRTRLLTKPGLTGWDQISGKYHSPSLEDSLEKLQYDLYYLKHRSLSLDISITLRTVATILSRSGN